MRLGRGGGDALLDGNTLGELPKRYIEAIHYIPKKETGTF